MKNYYAYHKEKEYGKFSGTRFITKKSLNDNVIGSNLYVISSQVHNPRYKYFLEGKFKIVAISSDGKNKEVTLVAIKKATSKIQLTTIDDIAKKYANGVTQFTTEISIDHLHLFDDLLSMSSVNQ